MDVNLLVNKKPVVVIGGGAAGMLAARAAALKGAPVLLLEKKPRLGTKILISGGGKCNLTHAGSMTEVRRAFRVEEGRFLQPSFYRFTNEDFLELLHEKGMETYTRPDGRVFPVPPADAKDVVALLEEHLRDAGVRTRLEASVSGLRIEEGAAAGVLLGGGETIECSAVIVATGGSSYPATGTTGDGWKWLADAGHSLVPLRAALAPVYLDPAPPAEWSGVALRDCVLKARALNADGSPGKEFVRWRGDLLWTHKGVSGPTALGVSREIAERIPAPSRVEADAAPDILPEKLAADLSEHCRKFPRRSVSDFFAPYVPSRLLGPFFAAAQVDKDVKGAYLAAKERSRLAQTLKAWPLGKVRAVPLERGEVVAGGVFLSEVDKQSMRSLKVTGLFLCGEVLDIAGPVGGYNLQAAWSTGVVAGESAAQFLHAGKDT